MSVTTVEGLLEYGVIVAGGIEAARDQVAERIGSRPMHKPWVNGYGSVHATVWVEDPQVLADWFHESHDHEYPTWPGDLLFFRRH